MAKTRLGSKLRKEQILDATLEIIAENGPSAVNTSEISRRVGIVPSALYRHFSGRENLIDALLERTEAQLREILERISGEDGDSLARLKRNFFLHIEMIRKNPGIPKLIFSDAIAFGAPQRKKKLLSILKTYMKSLESIVVTGQEEETISREILPRAAAFILVSLAQTTAIMLNLTENEVDITPAAESAWIIIEQGIIPGKDPLEKLQALCQ